MSENREEGGSDAIGIIDELLPICSQNIGIAVEKIVLQEVYYMSKILIVEDESALQKTLGDMLTKDGYEVVKALDGEIGLGLAKSELPNLIILDLILPKMNGFEVLKALKADPNTKTIPVIVQTNLESMDDIQRALGGGASTYLVKSNYSLEEVLQKVKQALQK